jgi:hypothetical protein
VTAGSGCFLTGLAVKRQEEPGDFCILNGEKDHRLTNFERLTLVGGTELDRAIGWMARQFGVVPTSQLVRDLDVEEVFKGLEWYEKSGWIDKPHTFFDEPSLTAPCIVPIHGMPDGEILDIFFPSRGDPARSAVLGGERQTAEDVVFTRLWRHHEPARGTIVGVHGWTMGDQRINSLAFLPGELFKFGFNVALIELPFHGRRRASGELRLSPLSISEAVRIAIRDLRALGKYLSSIDDTPFGAMGISLGGYLAALWSEIEPLAFCVPIVPLVELGELTWHAVAQQGETAKFSEQGLTVDHLKRLYSPHSPLTFEPHLSPENLLIVAGLGDDIIPSRQPNALSDHWHRPAIQWLAGGHEVAFERKKVFSRIAKFLQHRMPE